MNQDPWDKLLSICDELQALLDKAQPMADPPTLNRVRSLCRQLKGHDHYIDEKANWIERRAAVFFSARRHWKCQGGAAMLRTSMSFDMLGRIRNQIANHKAAK